MNDPLLVQADSTLVARTDANEQFSRWKDYGSLFKLFKKLGKAFFTLLFGRGNQKFSQLLHLTP